jgi:hypothetical protein
MPPSYLAVAALYRKKAERSVVSRLSATEIHDTMFQGLVWSLLTMLTIIKMAATKMGMMVYQSKMVGIFPATRAPILERAVSTMVMMLNIKAISGSSVRNWRRCTMRLRRAQSQKAPRMTASLVSIFLLELLEFFTQLAKRGRGVGTPLFVDLYQRHHHELLSSQHLPIQYRKPS